MNPSELAQQPDDAPDQDAEPPGPGIAGPIHSEEPAEGPDGVGDAG